MNQQLTQRSFRWLSLKNALRTIRHDGCFAVSLEPDFGGDKDQHAQRDPRSNLQLVPCCSNVGLPNGSSSVPSIILATVSLWHVLVAFGRVVLFQSLLLLPPVKRETSYSYDAVENFQKWPPWKKRMSRILSGISRESRAPFQS